MPACCVAGKRLYLRSSLAALLTVTTAHRKAPPGLDGDFLRAGHVMTVVITAPAVTGHWPAHHVSRATVIT